MPRDIILGAGAVGGAIGGRLGLAGRDVVLVARGDHLATIKRCSRWPPTWWQPTSTF